MTASGPGPAVSLDDALPGIDDRHAVLVVQAAAHAAGQAWLSDSSVLQRVSKKLAGRELDGRTRDEFPRVAEVATA